MPRPKRVHCKVCERHIDECGPLSARGKCEPCSIALQTEAVDAMFSQRGPLYERWAKNTTRGLLRSIERARSDSS